MAKRKSDNNIVGNIKVYGSTPKKSRTRKLWAFGLAKQMQSDKRDGLTISEIMKKYHYGRSQVYEYLSFTMEVENKSHLKSTI